MIVAEFGMNFGMATTIIEGGIAFVVEVLRNGCLQ